MVWCNNWQVPQVLRGMLSTFSSIKCTCLPQRALTVVGHPHCASSEARVTCELAD